MAKIDRYNGNLKAFGSTAQGTERTVFGDTTQSDTLDDNINADFYRGWGIVGVNENPTKQDFNGAMYTHGQLLAYLHQAGVPEYNASQEYHTDSYVTYGGVLYVCNTDSTTGKTPGTDPEWELQDISNTTYTHPGTGAVRRTVQSVLEERVSVADFGAVGDGSTDDTAAIQAAVDAAIAQGGGTVFFPMTAGGGDYRVTVTKGTNDKWGVKIDGSNITLVGENDVRLRRLDPDITTYAKAFPIVFIGKPDSDLIGDQVQNVKIIGLRFTGEDTNHGVYGDYLNDFRVALHFRNTRGTRLFDCTFEDIDSSAVWYQYPASYDYESSTYYNLTKNYDSRIQNCTFKAVPHSTPLRAYVHAVAGRGIDGAIITDNRFEWCDDAFSLDTTFQSFDQTEDDTYTDTNLGASVKRTGRQHIFSHNTVQNASEHAVYYTSMDGVISDNTINTDDPSVCQSDIKVRGRYVTVTGNTLSNVGAGVNLTEVCQNVTVVGNTIACGGDPAAGIISIESHGATAFIDDRSDWFTSYAPVKNLTVTGNTLIHLNATPTYGFGIRVYTDPSDTNYPHGQLQNVVIGDNVINNCKRALYFISPMLRRCKVSKNTISGPDFTEAGFSTGTTMGGESCIAVHYNQAANLEHVTFVDNIVYGYEYILKDYGGSGGASTLYPPRSTQSNRFEYIKYWDSAAFIQPSFNYSFLNNSGRYFLDRVGWYGSTSIGNSMSDGTANSEKKTMFQLVSSSDVRLYYDDAGGYASL